MTAVGFGWLQLMNAGDLEAIVTGEGGDGCLFNKYHWSPSTSTATPILQHSFITVLLS